MSLAGCQVNPIDVNFYLQESLEIFDTKSADKIQSQNYKGLKLPCFMPIRVKGKLPFSLCNVINKTCLVHNLSEHPVFR